MRQPWCPFSTGISPLIPGFAADAAVERHRRRLLNQTTHLIRTRCDVIAVIGSMTSPPAGQSEPNQRHLSADGANRASNLQFQTKWLMEIGRREKVGGGGGGRKEGNDNEKYF